MGGGETQLVAYNHENMFLNDNPQISFFKIIYRRYTNFSTETIRTDFIYQARFGKKYSTEISKLGDLIHKMWLVMELPDIPLIYNLENIIDPKLKMKWTRKIGYAMIDYVEIEIGGMTIQKHWGEWLNVQTEFNINNFNGSLDRFIGNTPELTTYKFVRDGIGSKYLYIPMYFWFCMSAGMALPMLCLEYNIVRFNIQLKSFDNCAIFSPTNMINK